MKYPTPAQIMRSPPQFPPKVLSFMKDWKKIWQQHKNYKHLSLTAMILGLTALYKKPCRNVIHGTKYIYQPSNQTIFLGLKPSIISTLHEIGHHLYGRSEYKACRFSVHLFKQTFPKSFHKLRWKKHTLIINK